MVFSTQYDRLLTSLVEDKAVLVRAQVLPEEGGPPKLSVQDIVPLENARVNYPSLISIRVPLAGNGGAEKAEEYRRLFSRKPGETHVRLRLEKPGDFSVILDVPDRIRPDREFYAESARISKTSEPIEILAN